MFRKWLDEEEEPVVIEQARDVRREGFVYSIVYSFIHLLFIPFMSMYNEKEKYGGVDLFLKYGIAWAGTF